MFKAKDIVSNLNLTLGTFKYLYRGIVLDIFISHQKGGGYIHEQPSNKQVNLYYIIGGICKYGQTVGEKLDC